VPDNCPAVRTHLEIRVSRGAGTGPTQLAAFDAALHAAGVAGYNIIRLSSVIPPHAVVRDVTGEELIEPAQGDVAYCVYAAAYASTPGEQAWAGMAWAAHRDGSGAGLFVEHTAASEFMVRRDLDATLETMSLSRGHSYRPAGQILCSAICVDHPVCAIVVATYGTAGWSRLIDPDGQQ
jgi:arginine decarboxylase